MITLGGCHSQHLKQRSVADYPSSDNRSESAYPMIWTAKGSRRPPHLLILHTPLPALRLLIHHRHLNLRQTFHLVNGFQQWMIEIICVERRCPLWSICYRLWVSLIISRPMLVGSFPWRQWSSTSVDYSISWSSADLVPEVPIPMSSQSLMSIPFLISGNWYYGDWM